MLDFKMTASLSVGGSHWEGLMRTDDAGTMPLEDAGCPGGAIKQTTNGHPQLGVGPKHQCDEEKGKWPRGCR